MMRYTVDSHKLSLFPHESVKQAILHERKAEEQKLNRLKELLRERIAVQAAGSPMNSDFKNESYARRPMKTA